MNLRSASGSSVVGFSDDNFAAEMVPPLTTVGQDGYSIGRAAAELVLGRSTGTIRTTEGKHVEIPVEMVERQSTSQARPEPMEPAGFKNDSGGIGYEGRIHIYKAFKGVFKNRRGENHASTKGGAAGDSNRGNGILRKGCEGGHRGQRLRRLRHAAEVAQWAFDFGGGGFDSSDATLSFSTDDANGSPTSGSLDVLLDFNNTNGDQNADITRGGLGGLDAATSGILMLDADIKVVAGSASDQFGQSGYFQFHTATVPTTISNGFCGQRESLPTAGGIFDVPLTSPDDAINALTSSSMTTARPARFPAPMGWSIFVSTTCNSLRPRRRRRRRASSGGHQFSFESASEIDSTHTGGSTGASFAFGDSYDGNVVDHTQSTLYPPTAPTRSDSRSRWARITSARRCFTTTTTQASSARSRPPPS